MSTIRVAAISAFFSAASGEVVRMPLEKQLRVSKRSEGTSRITKHFSSYRRTLRSLHQKSEGAGEIFANETQNDAGEEPVNVRLMSYHELAYTGPFSIGDGSKFVTIKNMVYDTGSELCWAFTANEGVKCCPQGQCDPVAKRLIGCDTDSKWSQAMRMFGGKDPACMSADAHQKLPLGPETEKFVVCYGRGFARGMFTNSIVRFHESHKGITHSFGVANTASDLEQDFGGCNGLIGLGPKNTDKNPSIIMRLYQQKVIDEPVFSFSLGNPTGPEFVLGGIDNKIVGQQSEMKWFPIKRQRLYSLWWTVDATLYSGDHSHTTPLVLDSGTTAVMIAKTHFDQFVRHVATDFGLHHKDPFLVGFPDGHIDFKHCDDPIIKRKRDNGGHALRIRIQEQDYVLNPKDYIVELKDHSRGCFFGVAYLSDQDDVAILGDVFMRKFYTAFHYDKDGRPAIGIATPSYTIKRRNMQSKKQKISKLEKYVSDYKNKLDNVDVDVEVHSNTKNIQRSSHGKEKVKHGKGQKIPIVSEYEHTHGPTHIKMNAALSDEVAAAL